MIKKLLYLFTAAVLLASCRPSGSANKNIVSVTILPQKYIVERLTDSALTVNVLVPQGMSPENCDFTIETLKALSNSSVCLYLGTMPFEQAQLLPFLENNKEIRGVCVADGCPENETDDPHVWLSPLNAAHIAKTTAAVLSELYPEMEETISGNCALLCSEFGSIDSYLRNVLEGKRSKTFLIYHPALTQFSHTYGLEQLAVENDGKEPAPAYLSSLLKEAGEKNASLFLIQSEIHETSAETVAKESGCTAVTFDPLAADFMAEMRHLAETFETYMK